MFPYSLWFRVENLGFRVKLQHVQTEAPQPHPKVPQLGTRQVMTSTRGVVSCTEATVITKVAQPMAFMTDQIVGTSKTKSARTATAAELRIALAVVPSARRSQRQPSEHIVHDGETTHSAKC